MATFTTEQLKAKYSAPSATPLQNPVPPTQTVSKGTKFTTDELKAKYQPTAPQPEQKTTEPGFVQSVVQSVTNPFLRLGANAVNTYKGIKALATQRPEEAQKTINENQQHEYDLGYLGKVKAVQPNLKDELGVALSGASNLVGGEGALPVAKAGLKGLIGQGIKQGVKTGFTSGALSGGGEALQENKDLGDVATSAIQSGLVGGTLGGVTGGVLPIGGKALNILNPTKREATIRKQITNDVSELFTANKALSNAEQLATQKNIPLREMVSDPEVFKGINVENGTIVPDEAVATIADRIDRAMEAKGKLLPEIDNVVSPIPRDVIRQKAKDAIRGTMSPADEQDVLNAIDKQVDALPERLNPSQIDSFRARFRKSARNAKGLQKSDSEYSALENASRDTLFEATDNLPYDTNKEFPQLNNYIKNLIGTQEFLDKTLRGKKVKGGRLGTYGAKIVGAIAGSHGGILTSIAGSELGGAIANILSNNSLGNSLKMKFISKMTDDPEVLKAVEKLIGKAKDYNPLRTLGLPAPKAIPMGGKTVQGTTEAERIANNQLQNSRIQNATLRLPAGKPSIISSPTLKMGGAKTVEKGVQPSPQYFGTQKQLPERTGAIQLPQPQKKSIGKASESVNRKKDPLTTEAKKYKSAEEFYNTMPSDVRDSLRTQGVRGQEQVTKYWESATGKSSTDTYQMSHRPTQTGATADNITQEVSDMGFPKDFYENPQYYTQISDKASKESLVALLKVRGNPDATVIIYRASPKKELNNGDWVTLSKEYAKRESQTEKTPVQSFKVKAKDIQFAGDDVNEFGYFPKSQLTDIWNKANKK